MSQDVLNTFLKDERFTIDKAKPLPVYIPKDSLIQTLESEKKYLKELLGNNTNLEYSVTPQIALLNKLIRNFS